MLRPSNNFMHITAFGGKDIATKNLLYKTILSFTTKSSKWHTWKTCFTRWSL